MALAIAVRRVEARTVIDVSGRLCFLEMGLRERVIELLSEGHRDFDLNLTEMTHLDSFGLGQLVSIWTSIQNKNGSMRLAHPNARVRKLLEITRLHSVFEIEAEQAAV
jgi:anti-sigma B factor antagonist